MAIDYIYEAAQCLKERYGTSDPWKLVPELGIPMRSTPFGTGSDVLKGMFTVIDDISHITINADLPHDLATVVLAHELGHNILHSYALKAKFFSDYSLFGFDGLDDTEFEATLFAAELLLPDDKIAALAHDEMDIFEMAGLLCVPPELIDIKIKSMIHRGHTELRAPLNACGDFLKN